MDESYFGGKKKGNRGEEQRVKYQFLGYLRGKVK
jgi:hypothetical protein